MESFHRLNVQKDTQRRLCPQREDRGLSEIECLNPRRRTKLSLSGGSCFSPKDSALVSGPFWSGCSTCTQRRTSTIWIEMRVEGCLDGCRADAPCSRQAGRTTGHRSARKADSSLDPCQTPPSCPNPENQDNRLIVKPVIYQQTKAKAEGFSETFHKPPNKC